MKGMKTNNKPFFQPIRSRQSARWSAELIDGGGITGKLKRDKTTVEKLSELFTLIRTPEELRKVPTVAVFLCER